MEIHILKKSTRILFLLSYKIWKMSLNSIYNWTSAILFMLYQCINIHIRLMFLYLYSYVIFKTIYCFWNGYSQFSRKWLGILKKKNILIIPFESNLLSKSVSTYISFDFWAKPLAEKKCFPRNTAFGYI